MKQEVLSLAEGDVVVRWPVSLSPRSRRQFKAWLAMLAEELRESAANAADPSSLKHGSRDAV